MHELSARYLRPRYVMMVRVRVAQRIPSSVITRRRTKRIGNRSTSPDLGKGCVTRVHLLGWLRRVHPGSGLSLI